VGEVSEADESLWYARRKKKAVVVAVTGVIVGIAADELTIVVLVIAVAFAEVGATDEDLW